MTQNQTWTASVGARKDGDDHWLMWLFPAGSSSGEVRRVESWADIERHAQSVGMTGRNVAWGDGAALTEMIEALGPPPHVP